MTTDLGFDQIASAWLADGPTELADRVLDDVLRDVRRTHQRRRPWAPGGTLAMTFHPTNHLATAGLAVLVALVALGGAIYLATPQGVGGPSPTPASPTPTMAPTAAGVLLSGTVWEANGTPVDAVVSAYAAPRLEGTPIATAKTDEHGMWQMSAPVVDRYCLSVDAVTSDKWHLMFGPSGWTTREAEWDCVMPAEAASGIRLSLPFGTPVSGTVRFANGIPYGTAGGRKVEVMASLEGETFWAASTVADAAGRFALDLPRGTWQLWFWAITGAQGTWPLRGPTVVVNDEPVTGSDFEADEAPEVGTIGGRITEANGEPVAARVAAYVANDPIWSNEARATTTDLRGRWTLDLEAGLRYCLAAQVRDTSEPSGWWLPTTPAWSVLFGDTGVVTSLASWQCRATSTMRTTDLVLPSIVPVSGTVVFANGDPIHPMPSVSSVVVWAHTGPRDWNNSHGVTSTTVGEDGTFSIALFPGQWTLSADVNVVSGPPRTTVDVGTDPVTGVVIRIP